MTLGLCGETGSFGFSLQALALSLGGETLLFGLDTLALGLSGETLLFGLIGETLTLSLGGDTGGLRFSDKALALGFSLQTLTLSLVGQTLTLSLGGQALLLYLGGLALAVKFSLTCGLCLGTTGRDLLARHIIGHQSATTGCGTTLSQVGLAVRNNLVRLQKRQFVTRGDTP